MYTFISPSILTVYGITLVPNNSFLCIFLPTNINYIYPIYHLLQIKKRNRRLLFADCECNWNNTKLHQPFPYLQWSFCITILLVKKEVLIYSFFCQKSFMPRNVVSFITWIIFCARSSSLKVSFLFGHVCVVRNTTQFKPSNM